MKETIKQIQRINPKVVEQLKELIGTCFSTVSSNRARVHHSGRGLSVSCAEEGCIKLWYPENRDQFYLWFKSGTGGVIDSQTGLRTEFPMSLKKYERRKVNDWYDQQTRTVDYSKAPFPDMTNYHFSMSMSIGKLEKTEKITPNDQFRVKEINIYQHIAKYYSEEFPNWDIDVLSLLVFRTNTGREFTIEMNSSIPEFHFYIDNHLWLERVLQLKVDGPGPTAGMPFHQLVHVIK